MSAAVLLTKLEAAGLSVRADGAELVLKPADRLTPALLAEVRTHKAELLRLLSARVVEVVPIGALPLWAYDLLFPPGPGDPPAVSPPDDLTPEQIATALDEARQQYDRYRRWWQMHPPLPGRPTKGPPRE